MTTANQVIRVALVDDQPLVRQGFAMLIGSQPDLTVCWQADDGSSLPEVTTMTSSEQPNYVDVIVMDVQMPHVDGITATQQLLAAGCPARILMLTTFEDADFVRRSLAAGASGFLLKDCQPEELLHAIRVIASGEAMLAPRITTMVLAQLAEKAQLPAAGVGIGVGQVVVQAGMLEVLTPREQEILSLMARGLSNDEIAAASFVSLSTVKTHVRHIFEKTGARDRVAAVLWAFTSGLVTPQDLR